MATLFDAIIEFGPRVVPGRTIEFDELVTVISRRLGVPAEEVEIVLRRLPIVLREQLQAGETVSLPGIGRFEARRTRFGRTRIVHTPDPEVEARLRVPGAFTGHIENAGSIGLDNAGYKALWDAAHPDDPMDLP